MKKLILLFVSFLFCCSPVKAQHYRGFVDFVPSLSVSMDGGRISTYNIFAFGATTSHGIQLNNTFIGLGATYMSVSNGEGCISAFIDGRYDFFNVHRSNFFIDCKIGNTYPVENVDFHISDKYNDIYGDYNGYAKYNGLFLNPSIGVRFRLTSSLGVNISLGYTLLRREITEIYFSGYQPPTPETPYEIGYKFTDNRISLSVGIDF